MLALDFIVSIMGLSFGSFIGACAYRIPRGISITTQRSFCPSCRSILYWYEIVPLFGFVLNGGKCRECGTRIPTSDLVIELCSGVLFVVMFLQHGASLQFLLFGSFGLLLMLIALIDWQHFIIPNEIIVFGIALGLVLNVARWQTDALLDSLVGFTVALFVMLSMLFLGNWLLKKETMGAGDVKLAALVGLYIGLEGFLVALWLAAAAGALFGLSRALFLGRRLDDKLPFGAFLAGASIFYVIFQSPLHAWVHLWLISILS